MTIKPLNLGKMQERVDKLLSVFTKLIAELNRAIDTLDGEITKNNEAIEKAKADNEVYESKIKEYNALKSNLEHIVK
jgi:hypothetical protein